MTAFARLDKPAPEASTAIGFDGELELSTYSAFFCAAISAEAKALQEECNEHDLYKVQLSRANQDSHQPLYLLYVPGLRETSLRIEVGDVVQIRQIRLDRFGSVIPQVSLRDRNGLYLPHAVTKQNDAVVWHLDRLRETVTLRVDFLHQSSPFFNARFTVQSGRMDALQRAVTSAQQQIKTSSNDWMRSM